MRAQYAAFESDVKAPASEVYLHEMPGGQYTNLKEQARSLGLDSKWTKVARTYSDVNKMFGDIVKVTPSSKVVGDMALMMVSQDLTIADVEDPKKDIAFPDSVVALMRGDLSRPADGFPAKIQKKVLKGKKPLTKRVGELLKPANLKRERKAVEKAIGRAVNDQEFESYLMYPKVFTDYALAQSAYGPMSALPTPNYFYGMEAGDEIRVEIERGKLLVIRCLAFGEMDEQGMVTVFFELNGQPRRARVPDRVHGGDAIVARAKADDGNPNQIGAPMPGVISTIMVEAGTEVSAGDVICSIEAMKMETALHAEVDGKVTEVFVKRGDQIDAKDLLVQLES